MANSQVFKVAGITTHGDNTKVRFTDDLVRRIKQFSKGGASRIDLIELPSAMSKLDALRYLQTHADFQSPGDQATVADSILDRSKETSKREVKVKVSKAKVSVKPSIDAIKARGKKSVEVNTVLAAIQSVEQTQAVE
jgi:hypothetical protein